MIEKISFNIDKIDSERWEDFQEFLFENDITLEDCLLSDLSDGFTYAEGAIIHRQQEVAEDKFLHWKILKDIIEETDDSQLGVCVYNRAYL